MWSTIEVESAKVEEIHFSFVRCSVSAQCSGCHLKDWRYFAFCCIMPQLAPEGVYLTAAAPCWCAIKPYFRYIIKKIVFFFFLSASLGCASAISPAGAEFKSIWPQGEKKSISHPSAAPHQAAVGYCSELKLDKRRGICVILKGKKGG